MDEATDGPMEDQTPSIPLSRNNEFPGYLVRHNEFQKIKERKKRKRKSGGKNRERNMGLEIGLGFRELGIGKFGVFFARKVYSSA